MENVHKIFRGTQKSGTDKTNLELYANSKNELFIHIEDMELEQFICLSEQTAVALCKELKRQIAVIKQNKI